MLREDNAKRCSTCSAWHQVADSPRYRNCGYCSRYDLKTMVDERCHSWDTVRLRT